MARHAGVAQRFKTKRHRAGTTSCDSCGWSAPAGLRDLGQTDGFRVLHAHHVHPIACGGADADHNLVLLCPNCHALAHRLGTMTPTPGRWPENSWDGTTHPPELLRVLRLLAGDPAKWTEDRDRELREAEVAEREATDLREQPEAERRRGTMQLISGARALSTNPTTSMRKHLNPVGAISK